MTDKTFVNPTEYLDKKVRVRHVQTGFYLGIEGDPSNWKNNGASLAMRDSDAEADVIWQVSDASNGYHLTNDNSKYLACIRDRTKDNGGTAIQYKKQWDEPNGQWEPFQEWTFKPKVDVSNDVSNKSGEYLIENVHSDKCLGPYNRSTTTGTWCTQWEDQSGANQNLRFQLWQFEKCD